jgi:hypothetical protein
MYMYDKQPMGQAGINSTTHRDGWGMDRLLCLEATCFLFYPVVLHPLILLRGVLIVTKVMQ